MTAKTAFADEHEDDLRPVTLPSGGLFWVYKREVSYFNDRVKRYAKDNHFTNISDLQDVDRMIVTELMIWRYDVWVSQQTDYWGESIDEAQLSRMIKDRSAELRAIKTSLGIDKISRDKQRGEDSTATYLAELRIRAKEFGVMRENQLAKALELFNEAKSLVVLHFNCTEDEQREKQVRAEDVLEWFKDVVIPEYDRIDEHFRKNQQKLWIRDI